MSKFENLNKETIPDPLTGGTQDIYTSKDGTFMMCIPDREIPFNHIPIAHEIKTEDKGNGIRVWSFELPNKTEDVEYEIVQPKQLAQPI